MKPLTIITTDGKKATLSDEAIQKLAGRFNGPLHGPEDENYDTTRQVHNGMIDRRPALIARCTGTSDVVAAVDFARENNALVSVRGGGHNVAGNAVCDDGLMIDLSLMKKVTVDPEARIVRAQGGASWAELDASTQEFALATTGGLVSSTGIAGFTLGGGIGWLMRRHGLACDNLVAAEVVTADGETLTAGEDNHSDLFWALRGGGGNFGIVTEFSYQLHPVGPDVIGGIVAWPTKRAGEVLRFWSEWAGELPDEMSTMAVFLYGPPEPFIPDALKGQPMIAIGVCHTDPQIGEKAVQPLRELDPPVDVIGPMPYLALQGMFDASAPKGMRNYWRSAFLSELGSPAIDTLIAHTADMPAPMGQIHLHQVGGAVARVSGNATAYSQRDAAFVLNVIGMWPEADHDENNTAWVKETAKAMAPHTTGHTYVNFLADEGAQGVRAAYGANYERLARIKATYDPDNLFRLNQNIPPAI